MFLENLQIIKYCSEEAQIFIVNKLLASKNTFGSYVNLIRSLRVICMRIEILTIVGLSVE